MGKVIVEKRGRITIPSRIRAMLGIKEGTELEVGFDSGKLILKPVLRVSAKDLYGVAGEERVNIEEIEEALGGEE
ncbi:MAG: AbrB/MazE/SpoVT family DNA-binding domain-containing protein [Candidatus Bathyarchaeia archaeon]